MFRTNIKNRISLIVIVSLVSACRNTDISNQKKSPNILVSYYGGDIFNVSKRNNLFTFLFTPTCAFEFEAVKSDGIYILTGTDNIDCVFWNDSLNKALSSNNEVFAKLEEVNDSTFNVEYININFTKGIVDILEGNYFPKTLNRK